MSNATGRLHSARQRLDAARLLLDHEFEPDAMSRLYFGVLESARTLLLRRDLAPKTHKGIAVKLAEHFRSHLDIGLLIKLRQNREEADYRLHVPTSAQVEHYLQEAEHFIEMAAKHIEEEN